MRYIEIKMPKGKSITVLGDVHEHPEQFEKILQLIKPNENNYLVSLGDIYDKGAGIKAAEEITQKLIEYQRLGLGFAVRGNHELKHLKRNKNNLSSALEWWSRRPLSISFVFENGTRITVVHGGVKPSHTWDDLGINAEVCFIRDIDENGKMIKLKWVNIEGKATLIPEKLNGKNWHDLYDGRFGYIAAGHAHQKDGIPKFYNYSCNLDTGCFITGKLTAQVFSENGREGLIQVEGTPLFKE